MQLLRARDAVMQRFRPHLRKQGLTDQQGRILRTLAETERLEMSELAARTSIHPASLSRIIPGLERKGIVRRWKNDADARRVAVSITKRGLAVVQPVMRQSKRIYAQLAAQMGPGHWRELHRCLEMLIKTSGKTVAATGNIPSRRTRRVNGAAAPGSPMP
ncbi:MAG TPA: homoprotocatechuate degradation operon regulator HpaR [Stellaceae bacterium]|nr:homoprotocatechuate degradation operon regulator HpaR [Stellaceae bacterium]